MSIHRSFVGPGGMQKHRNVLSRDERIARMREEERWKEGRSLFGLPKLRSIKPKKKAKAKKEDAAVVVGTPVAAAPVADVKAASKAAAGAKSAGAAKPDKGKPAKG
ncbi:MAG: small basic protein [Planctomycetes bacterium]|nr:small basic protein [Planctomycetota bacterium]